MSILQHFRHAGVQYMKPSSASVNARASSRSLATLLSGTDHAREIRRRVAEEVGSFVKMGCRKPCLAVIRVGNDPASAIYVDKKLQACSNANITGIHYHLRPSAPFEELSHQIYQLNRNPTIDGILLQLPLPDRSREAELADEISIHKDVDGLHSCNLGRLVNNDRPVFQPCTPLGILHLLSSINPNLDELLEGKRCIVIGSSAIVGKPLALQFMRHNATVIVCNKFTKELPEEVARADVVVSATGVPELVKGAWIKQGAIVVDVGCHRRAKNTIVGDVEFEEAFKRASFITPVPGGVGPMTVAYVIHNTMTAFKRQMERELQEERFIYSTA